MARRACPNGTENCILWDIDHPVCVVPEGPPPPGEQHERSYQLVDPKPDLSPSPFAKPEVTPGYPLDPEEQAWLGAGPETRRVAADRDFRAGVWRGLGLGVFSGALAGGGLSTLLWLLLG